MFVFIASLDLRHHPLHFFIMHFHLGNAILESNIKLIAIIERRIFIFWQKLLTDEYRAIAPVHQFKSMFRTWHKPNILGFFEILVHIGSDKQIVEGYFAARREFRQHPSQRQNIILAFCADKVSDDAAFKIFGSCILRR